MAISSFKDTQGSENATGPIAARPIALSPLMLLVTVGVVYGDIGTSPLYVMKAIVNGNGGLTDISEGTIVGALSLIIWTLTLITTIKYVVIALRADNNNEGGIFALYSLVRRFGRPLIIFAVIGGAALLADGILTPAVTVTTAIEGLRTVSYTNALLGEGQKTILLITVAIIVFLFLVQRSGTSNIGRAFGPIMVVWFLFLGCTGIMAVCSAPEVLRALNPIYGIMFLLSPQNHAGFMVLGSVFLATTGAEALYSDMGHVGKANIHASWPFVKICLIANYLGQGAWLLTHSGDAALSLVNDMNPFFEMLPPSLRPFSIILSTLAAIIASQALISGSFTLVSEAMRLDLMPHMKVSYPSKTKGQIFIPLVNLIMGLGCVGVVLFFQSSSRMEAAYGLAITLTMLMTTVLMSVYLRKASKHSVGAVVFCVLFGSIELSFFLSSLTKFMHGGYVTIIIASILALVMVVWLRGTSIEHAQSDFFPMSRFVEQFLDIRGDTSLPVFADNLVFITNNPQVDLLERDILFSIFDGRPKRARAYWFVNISVTDEPYTHAYSIHSFGTEHIFKVQLDLGFKIDQFVGIYLRQIIGDLVRSGEVPPQTRHYSVPRRHDEVGDIKFCLLRKYLAPESSISRSDRLIMSTKYSIRRICGSPIKWYGLEPSDTTIEYVPLFGPEREVVRLRRTLGWTESQMWFPKQQS